MALAVKTSLAVKALLETMSGGSGMAQARLDLFRGDSLGILVSMEAFLSRSQL